MQFFSLFSPEMWRKTEWYTSCQVNCHYPFCRLPEQRYQAGSSKQLSAARRITSGERLFLPAEQAPGEEERQQTILPGADWCYMQQRKTTRTEKNTQKKTGQKEIWYTDCASKTKELSSVGKSPGYKPEALARSKTGSNPVAPIAEQNNIRDCSTGDRHRGAPARVWVRFPSVPG